MIILELLIPPKPLKRARHSSRGKFISTYYTAKDKQEMDTLESAIINALTQENKDYINEMLKTAHKGLEIHLSLMFGFAFPQSYSKKKKDALLHHGHTLAPDLDNLTKNVLDRGNGILWSDDKLITYIWANKVWSEYNYIKIEIYYESTQ